MPVWALASASVRPQPALSLLEKLLLTAVQRSPVHGLSALPPTSAARALWSLEQDSPASPCALGNCPAVFTFPSLFPLLPLPWVRSVFLCAAGFARARGTPREGTLPGITYLAATRRCWPCSSRSLSPFREHKAHLDLTRNSLTLHPYIISGPWPHLHLHPSSRRDPSSAGLSQQALPTLPSSTSIYHYWIVMDRLPTSEVEQSDLDWIHSYPVRLRTLLSVWRARD